MPALNSEPPRFYEQTALEDGGGTLQFTESRTSFFMNRRVALFVDGCFWHGCSRCYQAPKSSVTFWRTKIQRNMRRDVQVSRYLRGLGWKVIRVRECQLDAPARFLNRLKKLI